MDTARHVPVAVVRPAAATGAAVIRVVVAGEVGFYRDGLAYVLPRYNIAVVGLASCPTEIVAQAVALVPDVALLDMTMRGSLDVLREIAVRLPSVKLLALSVREREPDVLACVEAGASGYVTRDRSLDDLIDAIGRAVRGEPLASPRIVAMLMRRLALVARTESPLPTALLTARELQIVRLIDQGLSNKEIGALLYIEVATVKNHVHNILEKMHVKRRGEAAARLRQASMGVAIAR